MIYIAENGRSFADEIAFLSRNDPFGCRIISLYKTYNYNLPFVDFWVQFIDNKPVSLLSRLDSGFVLRLSDRSDIDEISSFIGFSGAESVICTAEYELDLDYKKTTGPVLFADSLSGNYGGFEVCSLNAKQAYSIIEKRASDNFPLPSYESFILDVSQKLKRNSVRILGVKEGSVPASCVMTLAESDDSAVLGAVATAPEFSGRGYGSFLVKKITDNLLNENKCVFLHRAYDENVEFYNRLGFKQFGFWTEYKE